MNAGLAGSTFWAPVISAFKLARPRFFFVFVFCLLFRANACCLWFCLSYVGIDPPTACCCCTDLAREPRWGRNIEVPGEDPYLVGEYAEWFVKGFERGPEDPEHIQASACCKHYAANSMEHTTEGGVTHTRHEFSANITQQDLVDSYLLPFQSCVEKGEVSGLMCRFGMSLIVCSF